MGNAQSPFLPDNDSAYATWRQQKLASYPASWRELIVPVQDPCHLSSKEHKALLERINRCNMAIYRSNNPAQQAGAAAAMDSRMMRTIGAQFGLGEPDCNWLSDDNAISHIEVARDSPTDRPRGEYIPYSNLPISWHTDGYYHPENRRIRAMLLHCVRPAQSGGENTLLDHEMLFMKLRECNPEHIRTLMASDVLGIPERVDENGISRPEEQGPVFWIDEAGKLYMRYTDRTRSIIWKDDTATKQAVQTLKDILSAPCPHMFHLRLRAGMGIVCNNVLHKRAAFTDDPSAPRLLYRARYTRSVTKVTDASVYGRSVAAAV